MCKKLWRPRFSSVLLTLASLLKLARSASTAAAAATTRVDSHQCYKKTCKRHSPLYA